MKTSIGAYLKKDKDHDVLGNFINPKKHLIPKELKLSIEIDGKKYSLNRDRFQIQCAKCLFMYSILALPDDGKDERQLYFEDQECWCENKLSMDER